jgi:hypothetical protein
MRVRTRTTVVTVAAAMLVAATATAAQANDSRFGLIQVSHGDPYAGCTAGATPTSTLYPGAEVEPSITVDPRRPERIVGAWQQDRWNNGGAHGIATTYSTDGGRTFTEVPLPVSVCAPGGLNYERASDPWVSTGPDGTVYASALAFDANTPRNTVAASVSYDGGRTWRHTTPLINDTAIEFADDKNSVTADPRRAGTAYQVWDRLDGGPAGDQLITGPTFLSVTHDYGRSWSTPQIIVHTAEFQQTIGNIIVADPRTGTLYDFYDSLTFTDASANTVTDVSYRMVASTDGGRHWSAPVVIAPDTSIFDTDPNTGAPLRTGSGLPSAAIDPSTGQLYLAYEGSDFTAGAYDQIQLTTSTDSGRHWSAPIRVNGAPSSPAFTPSIAVTASGEVGVTYYDIRTLRPDNTTTLPTSTWLTVSARGGTHFGHERQIAPVFDFLAAPRAGGSFLGDYEGLAATGDGFRALFMTTNSGQPNNRTDAYTGQFTGPDRDTPPGAAVQFRSPATVVGPYHRPLTRR